MVNFSQRMYVPEAVLFRELEGEAVILNLESEAYYGLDEVGTRMWEVLSTSTTLEGAFEQLLSEYDVEPTTLRTDLQEFVDQLATHGLVALSNA